MRKIEYIEYLRSSDWKERRKILLEEADNKCFKCGENAKQLHHLNYYNLGNEILNDDVIALCNKCHKEIHGVDDYGEYQEYKEYY